MFVLLNGRVCGAEGAQHSWSHQDVGGAGGEAAGAAGAAAWQPWRGHNQHCGCGGPIVSAVPPVSTLPQSEAHRTFLSE